MRLRRPAVLGPIEGASTTEASRERRASALAAATGAGCDLGAGLAAAFAGFAAFSGAGFCGLSFFGGGAAASTFFGASTFGAGFALRLARTARLGAVPVLRAGLARPGGVERGEVDLQHFLGVEAADDLVVFRQSLAHFSGHAEFGVLRGDEAALGDIFGAFRQHAAGRCEHDAERVEAEADIGRGDGGFLDGAVEHARQRDGGVADQGGEDVLQLLVEPVLGAAMAGFDVVMVDHGLVVLGGDGGAGADHLLEPVVACGNRHVGPAEIVLDDRMKFGEGAAEGAIRGRGGRRPPLPTGACGRAGWDRRCSETSRRRTRRRGPSPFPSAHARCGDTIRAPPRGRRPSHSSRT